MRRPGSVALSAPHLFLALPWRSVLAARADVAALLAILAVFSFVCFQQLTEPGLYEDEAWSATPAVRMVMGRSQIDVGAYHQFTAFGHVLPYMRNGYVGPVKTLLVAATFSAFGISVFVLRATTSLVGLATVLILYVFVRREFGRAAALAAALLLATDLSYVLAVRDDWGPVALGMLARVLSLALLFAWYRARTRTALLCAAMFTLGIGVTHKVDLAAFVLSILAAGALVFGRQLRVRWPEAIAALASFAAGVWPVVLYNVLTQGGTLQEGERLAQGSLATRDPLSPEGLWLVVQALPSAFSQRVSLLDGLLSGTGIADWLSGAQLEHASPLGPSPLPAVSVVAGLVLLALLLTGRLGDRARPVAFLLATFAFTFLFIVIAPIASGQHHVLGLYPLPHLMVGICIGILWQRRREMPRWTGWSTRALATATLLITIVPGLMLARTFYDQVHMGGGYWYWSDAIYDLADALRGRYQGRTVELLDWGFEQPLTLLGRDQFPIEVPFWIISQQTVPDQDMIDWLNYLITRPNHVWVMRADVFEFDQAVHDRFRAALLAHPEVVVREERFFQRDGEYAFSVFEIDSATATQ